MGVKSLKICFSPFHEALDNFLFFKVCVPGHRITFHFSSFAFLDTPQEGVPGIPPRTRILTKRFFGSVKKILSEKIVCQKKFGSEKNIGSENFWVRQNFWCYN